MNIKAILLSLLVAASSCANNEQLNAQLVTKQEQLNNLSKEIIKQDKMVSLIFKQLQECVTVFKKNKKKQLNNTLSDDDFNTMYMNEVEHFVQKFFLDQNSKKEQVLFDDAIFGKDTALLKFYIINYSREITTLEKLLQQWGNLSDEISYLENQLTERN